MIITYVKRISKSRRGYWPFKFEAIDKEHPKEGGYKGAIFLIVFLAVIVLVYLFRGNLKTTGSRSMN